MSDLPQFATTMHSRWLRLVGKWLPRKLSTNFQRLATENWVTRVRGVVRRSELLQCVPCTGGYYEDLLLFVLRLLENRPIPLRGSISQPQVPVEQVCVIPFGAE